MDVITYPKVASLTGCKCARLFAQRTYLSVDLYSYVREESLGLGCHNIVTVVMHQHQLDHNGAMNLLEIHITKRFLENRERHPLQTYIDGLGYWVRGNDCWSFEGHRYFGENRLAIQKDRRLRLQPPGVGYLGRRRQPLSLQH
ncbi:hypothetical protein BDZ94DRAFT_1365201 [Collybia nuda]|uniref:Uncharacterized protein n=1 Tax=Collybia nuda TaxID=64659 RepID=A0A9P6CJE4_9AGAR|nr:hypothetical protein BDZ94DRAFT_1365201 [Collybia nuda]